MFESLAKQKRVDLPLRKRVIAALLADVDKLASVFRLLEQLVGGEPVVDDRVRPANRLKPLHRYQPRVARAGADERDCAGHPLHEPKVVDSRPVNGGNGDAPVDDGRQYADRAMAVGPGQLEEGALCGGDRLRLVVAKRVDHCAKLLVRLAKLDRELPLVRRGDHPLGVEIF